MKKTNPFRDTEDLINESGFIQKVNNTSLGNSIGNSISSALKKIASLGLKYDDMVVKQSKSVGATEAAFAVDGPMTPNMAYALQMADIGNKKYISFFDKEYLNRREFLRKFAMNGEIEFILDTLADESIVYDMKNFFCSPDTSNLEGMIRDEKREEMINAIHDNFKKIYVHFHFNDDISAWQYYKQFLIDGFLAFEIIYNEKATKIIGFKELDSTSLRPDIEQGSDGIKKIWWQYENNPRLKRKLYDSQVIYISYAKSAYKNRISYTERLVRSFNLLRIMENTRVIWSIMNSTFRLKMVVPIGSKSPQKAKESLAELMAIYKEDIHLDYDSGELIVNGRSSVGQFYKNYMFPSKNGEQTEIETISGDGPDLSSTDGLKYYEEKKKKDSKLPESRFNSDSGGGQVYISAEGMDREEVRFQRFVNRLRSIFQEILQKPLWIQMTLDYPELATDELFKANLGIRYVKDNVFERMREKEVMQKEMELIMTLKDVMEDDGATAFFSTEWLVQKYLGMSRDELKENKKYKDDKKASGNDDENAKKSLDAFDYSR